MLQLYASKRFYKPNRLMGPSPPSKKHAHKTCTCRHAHGFLHTETCAVKDMHACMKHVHE